MKTLARAIHLAFHPSTALSAATLVGIASLKNSALAVIILHTFNIV